MQALRTMCAFGLIALLPAPAADGQELDTRAYSNVPVGVNLLQVGFGHSTGNILVDPSVPVEGLEAVVHHRRQGHELCPNGSSSFTMPPVGDHIWVVLSTFRCSALLIARHDGSLNNLFLIGSLAGLRDDLRRVHGLFRLGTTRVVRVHVRGADLATRIDHVSRRHR